MKREFDRIASESYDLLVIGGGIIGAGIARDAALRGWRVLLVDKGDFANGTSSRSSKLIHGGLRYLENGELKLVREACGERRSLLEIAPHLVWPLPLVLPVYRGRGRPLWQVRAGLELYDRLAGDKNIGAHRMLDPGQIARLQPGIDTHELEGGGLYLDCQMNDARLCIENIADAADAGAVALNYAEVVAFEFSVGRIVGAVVRDGYSGRESSVRAAVTVNATGPWADSIRHLSEPDAEPLVRRTKGVHLLTRRLTELGIAFHARRDNRFMFILPYGKRHTMIGTTDTDSAEDPGYPSVEERDVEYLLSEAAGIFPHSNLSRANITGAFAGLRTLVRRPGHPSSVSREYRIETDRNGLISIIGGKFTTYRLEAKRVADLARKRLGFGAPCRTDSTPLACAPGPHDLDELSVTNRGRLSIEMVTRLWRRYGGRAKFVLDLLDRDASLADEISPGSWVIWAELVHTVEREMVMSPIDFFRRRTAYALMNPPADEVLDRANQILRRYFNWSDAHCSVEFDKTRAMWPSWRR